MGHSSMTPVTLAHANAEAAGGCAAGSATRMLTGSETPKSQSLGHGLLGFT